MRVLITNNTLDAREGSEIYVRDLALALLARGHQPVAYSRRLGEVGEELRRARVPVVDDLERLTDAPDIIHGQHHLEVMTALLRFPAVPAIFVCHGWLPAEEAPPRSPRIRRIVAVDDLCRERLVAECGVPPESVVVLRNGVDLDRFALRPPLPPRPRRALAFGNRFSEANDLATLRRACEALGIDLDAVGTDVGRPCAAPEKLLGSYDVVFAKGRSALEAAVVGASVVLCRPGHLGPLVTTAELDELRRFNFGLRLLQPPLTESGVRRELLRYDAADAGEVTRRLRAEADFDTVVERLLALYAEAIEDLRRRPSNAGEEAAASHAYLRWGPLRGGDFFSAERERLLAEQALLRARADEARAAEASARGEAASLRDEAATLQQAQVALRDEVEAARGELAAAHGELAAAHGELAAARGELAAQRGEVLLLRGETDALQQQLRDVHESATWRVRQRLVQRGWLVRWYRWLKRAGP